MWGLQQELKARRRSEMGELGLRPEIPTPPRPEDSDSSGTAAEARTRGAPHTCTQRILSPFLLRPSTGLTGWIVPFAGEQGRGKEALPSVSSRGKGLKIKANLMTPRTTTATTGCTAAEREHEHRHGGRVGGMGHWGHADS